MLIHGFSPVNARLLIRCGTTFYAIIPANVSKPTPVLLSLGEHMHVTEMIYLRSCVAHDRKDHLHNTYLYHNLSRICRNVCDYDIQ